MKVFVYGTLKSGFGNHYLLRDSKKVCNDSITGTMYSLGGFPAITLKNDNKVFGEVYDVNKNVMGDLDMLEGYPRFYDRKIIKTDDGHYAHVYYMDLVEGPLVETGVWK